jgi:hypothetical protein
LIEEELRPVPIPLHERLLFRLCLIGIHRRQIFTKALRVQLHPRHGLKGLFHAGEPVMDQTKHLVGLP